METLSVFMSLIIISNRYSHVCNTISNNNKKSKHILILLYFFNFTEILNHSNSSLTLKYLIVLIASPVVPFLFNAAKPFLHEDTRRKMKILGSKYNIEWKHHIT